jgi:hypothetical protein
MGHNNINKDFYDIDLNFKPTLDKDVGTLRATSAISAGIWNYLNVVKTEKLFEENWGLGLHTYLFEIDKDSAFQQIVRDIEQFIVQDEPRILRAASRYAILNANTGVIELLYQPKNTPQTFEYSLKIDVRKGNQ